MTELALPVSPDDLADAARRLAGVAHRTPTDTSSLLSAASGREVVLKCEFLQRTGSFKFRGAYNLLAQLTPTERGAGVIAASSGNHAQAVSLAARLLGCSATILMPTDAPAVKVEATRSYGAVVEFFDRQRVDAESLIFEVAAERGSTIVPAFDHPHIIAGAGTAASELVAEHPDLDAILVPVGGGGLLAGTLVAIKQAHPGIAVFGVETEGADDTKLSLLAGERVSVPPPTTIADGIRLRTPGALTFEVVRALVDDVLVVSDDAVRDALRFLFTRTKHVIEPSGAVPVAALMGTVVPPRYRRVGVLATGGNVDPALLRRLWPGDGPDHPTVPGPSGHATTQEVSHDH